MNPRHDTTKQPARRRAVENRIQILTSDPGQHDRSPFGSSLPNASSTTPTHLSEQKRVCFAPGVWIRKRPHEWVRPQSWRRPVHFFVMSIVARYSIFRRLSSHWHSVTVNHKMTAVSPSSKYYCGAGRYPIDIFLQYDKMHGAIRRNGCHRRLTPGKTRRMVCNGAGTDAAQRRPNPSTILERILHGTP